MSMFFVEKSFDVQELIVLHGEDAHHITKVLRYRPGDVILISNGVSIHGSAVIEEIGAREKVIKARVLEKNIIKKASPKITLFQGIPKGDKMDFILQKNTEIGVCNFVPVITERTVVELSGEKVQRRTRRWQKIAREAAKQCQRPDIPKVLSPVAIKGVLENFENFDLTLVPWEKEDSTKLKALIRSKQDTISSVAVFIGPEGGISEEEIETLTEAGFLSISLGPRILRTETAGIVVNSVLMYELGELGG